MSTKYKGAFDMVACEQWIERQGRKDRKGTLVKKFRRDERHLGAPKHRGREKEHRPVRVSRQVRGLA
jgi:hypothetical protein